MDEFQKLPEITEAVKVLYDEAKGRQKFFLSESGSLRIGKTSAETLAGKSLRFKLFSLSFGEFLQVKPVNLKLVLEGGRLLSELFSSGKEFAPEKLESLLLLEKGSIFGHFSQYLFSGGYPRIVKLSSASEILTIYQGIKEAFLEKDMGGLIKAENLYSLEKLMEVLAARIGNIISFEGVSRDLQLKVATVRNLTTLLENSFWLKLIYPLALFGGEYKQAPKVYFQNIGFRNAFLSFLALPNDPKQLDQIAENVIFNTLSRFFEYRSLPAKINFWQSYKQAETDFVVDLGSWEIGIKSKYRYFKRPILGKGTKSFLEKYKPRFYLILNHNLFASERFGKTKVFFLPLWAFALLV